MECGELLLKRTKIRDTPKMCADCRGNKSNGTSQMRKLFIELSKRKIETTEDEMWFEDATNIEVDDARYIRVPTEATYGGSGLAEIMTSSDTNKYRHKHGSATQGTRYTYKKGEANG
jgi:hypothetical protein